MNDSFEGKVAFVTGGASGIGAALSRELARRGARVVIADRQSELAGEVVESIRSNGGEAESVELDVTDFQAFRARVDDVFSRYGTLDLLFNNAGIGIGGEVKNMEIDDWNRILDVNVHGVINGVQAVYRRMIEQGHGHIVNTASAAGLGPTPLSVAYSATKYAVVGLSQSLRAEAATEGVKVSVICPGVIRTPILEGGRYGKIIGFDAKGLVDMWEMVRPMDVDVFARKVLNQVEKNRNIIVVPGWWKISWWMTRLSPTLSVGMARAAYRHTLKKMGKV